MKYDILKPWQSLDPWQEKILATQGNICVRSGRQVGKSTVVSIKAGEYAMKNKNKIIMVVAAVERSAFLLFEKVLSYIHARNKKIIKGRPTKSKIELRNGSKILCLPTGDSGYGIRGHTIDLLIADEAAFINEDVWTAVVPMLTVTGGDTWLLSTPKGKSGYFYDSFNDETYTNFHISTPEVKEIRSGILRDNMESFIESAKRRFTKAQYAQEILGEFVDELKQFFSDELIKKCCVGKSESYTPGDNSYYLGVDVARMGEDETTFEILRLKRSGFIRHSQSIIRNKVLITETTREIIRLNEEWNFNRIGLDDGGMGVGVLDPLLEYDATKRKVIALNNASRDWNRDGKHKALLKEDMYNNLLRLMEKGEIILLEDEEVRASLKSIQYEYTDKNMKIFGSYSHITEGLIRAAWCIKSKGLSIWIT